MKTQQKRKRTGAASYSGRNIKRHSRAKKQTDLQHPLPRSIVLVGLMGCGKSTVGIRLAKRLGLNFVDSDTEIETAAGLSISDIFEKFGETEFRNGERRVMERLLAAPPQIIATGGGAFMDPDTRAKIKEHGISIWLKADVALLVERTSRKDTRPLLQNGDPAKILQDLADLRYPVYAKADITVETGNGPHDDVVNALIAAINRYMASTKTTTTP